MMSNTGTSKKSDDGAWETVKVVLQALAIAFVIRTFFFQPFNIPSGSMIPTLHIGDYVFVNKLSYGYSKHSFNMNFSAFGISFGHFGPMDFESRVFAGEPERGDVVVFKLPTDIHTDYIKRVIGLPGDKIQVRNSRLYINGEIVKRERIADYFDPRDGKHDGPIRQFRETLPNGVSYPTLDRGDDEFLDNTRIYVVPPQHYFMMGDNRDNSTDSRVTSVVGYVPYENLVGQADIVFFSHEPQARIWAFWRWFSDIRWRRLFHIID